MAGHDRSGARLRELAGAVIYQWKTHDPEKWMPVFGKDHAQKVIGNA
jgi:hypothetical protein